MQVNVAKRHELVCIIDRSSSMEVMRETAIEGFNQFLNEQKALPGEARISLVLFDTTITPQYQCIPLAEAPKLTMSTYVPQGTTALNDAIATTIINVSKRLAEANQEKDTKVLVMVLTDGQENSSQEYRNPALVREIIEKKEKDGWEFIYLSSDPRGQQDSLSLGIQQDKYHHFAATSKGLAEAYTQISRCATDSRNARF